MQPGDLVRCKELWRPTGVMGSKLESYKPFFEIGIILKVKKSEMVEVLRSNSKIIMIKAKHLEVL